MKIVIAEKPSVAREIARVLGANSRAEGYSEGSGYIVSWAIGHLCDIAPPDKQNPQWKKWDLDTLPMIPSRLRLEILPQTKPQFEILKKLLNKPEVSEVIEATDAGREGELIFRRIYQATKCKKPIRRLWLSSMTNEAIGKALDNLRPGEDYRNLAASAYARAESDWLVGMNKTRAFTLKCGGELITVGRVQTPVLAMLVKRRLEIENFTPQIFWEIDAFFQEGNIAFKALWHEPPELKRTRIFEEDKADQVHQKCIGYPAVVDSATQKKGASQPPLLYDLTSLQRACNVRFGFSAKKTLSIAQDLYEKQKLLTYPRTDSQYISKDIFKNIAQHFIAIRTHYQDVIASLRKCYEPNAKKYRVVNDKKVTDHHAIIPTTHQADLSALTDDQRKVYDLVCRRFMAAFLPPAAFLSSEIWLIINNEKFKATGKVFEKLGWLEAEPWAVKDDNPLPSLQRGQVLEVKDLIKTEKQTKPPPHYTDSSLLRAMETAGKRVEDEELAEAMKERGLGTPATRAQIIEGLLSEKRGYAERKSKMIVATDKGLEAVRIIGELLSESLSPDLTGEWEFKLKLMERGELTYQDFMREINIYVASSINKIKAADVQFSSAAKKTREGSDGGQSSVKVLGKCPLCGGDVVETPKAYGCSNWKSNGCKFAIWKNSFGAQGFRQVGHRAFDPRADQQGVKPEKRQDQK